MEELKAVIESASGAGYELMQGLLPIGILVNFGAKSLEFKKV